MSQTSLFDNLSPRFDGSTFEVEFDQSRLTGQQARVFAFISDGCWHTLAEIARATGDPESSVSARLRDLRKQKFGLHEIERRPRGERRRGLFEYRLSVPK